MLVLTRKQNEMIRCKLTEDLPAGTEIWVGVSDSDRGQVKIAFDAPRSVEILREEVVTRSAARPERRLAV